MTKTNNVLNHYIKTNGSTESSAKVEAAKNIKALLNTIDLHVEEVPENNPDMLTRLILSLKGKPLSKEEVELIHEISK